MSRRFTQWVSVLAALAVLVGVLAYNSQQMQSGGGPPGSPPVDPSGTTARGNGPSESSGRVPMPRQSPPSTVDPSSVPATQAAPPPDVSVLSVRAATHQAWVTGYGEAKARYELTLAAQVAGSVAVLGADLETGRQVSKGDQLVQLEDSDYRAAVAAAEHDLAAARLALLEEERQGAQAKAEWAGSGLQGSPDSPLVLRGPHLAAAKAAVTQAEAALASARVDLTRTRIAAPFDALVIERQVAPGSYLQSGSEVARLYSTDRVEVAVPLSARDWRSLPDAATLDSGDWPAELISVEDGQRWSGRVLRAESHRDEETRQRALVVALDRPLEQAPSLFPGTFVRVRVAGRALDALWKLPSSSLSQRGEIWYVRDDDTLASFPAEPLFADADAIYIAPPQVLAMAPQRVLVHPLNGYLQGMAVSPRRESTDASD